MANTIKHKRSAAAGVEPSSLADGELAINTDDFVLYAKDSAGNIREIGSTAEVKQLLLALTEAGLSLAGTSNKSVRVQQDLFMQSGKRITWGHAGDANVDTMWYDDGDNTYHFTADSVYGAAGINSNAKLEAKHFYGKRLEATEYIKVPHNGGGGGFYRGTGDSANYNSHNTVLKGWNGMGLADYSDTVNGVYNFRQGKWDVKLGYDIDEKVLLRKGSNDSLGVTTPHGWVQMGAQNSTYAHFYTDRGKFYFDKSTYIKGSLYKYTSSSQASEIYHTAAEAAVAASDTANHGYRGRGGVAGSGGLLVGFEGHGWQTNNGGGNSILMHGAYYSSGWKAGEDGRPQLWQVANDSKAGTGGWAQFGINKTVAAKDELLDLVQMLEFNAEQTKLASGNFTVPVDQAGTAVLRCKMTHRQEVITERAGNATYQKFLDTGSSNGREMSLARDGAWFKWQTNEGFRFRADANTILDLNPDGSVSAYAGNQVKLRTQSTGIRVYGEIFDEDGALYGGLLSVNPLKITDFDAYYKPGFYMGNGVGAVNQQSTGNHKYMPAIVLGRGTDNCSIVSVGQASGRVEVGYYVNMSNGYKYRAFGWHSANFDPSDYLPTSMLTNSNASTELDKAVTPAGAEARTTKRLLPYETKAENNTKIADLGYITAQEAYTELATKSLASTALSVAGQAMGLVEDVHVLTHNFSSSGRTTDFIAELKTLGCFEHGLGKTSYKTIKAGWSYSGNNDLVTGDPAIGSIELAGCLIETWCGSAAGGFIHIRVTTPNTGGVGSIRGAQYVYNSQNENPITGISYSPGWRAYYASGHGRRHVVNTKGYGLIGIARATAANRLFLYIPADLETGAHRLVDSTGSVYFADMGYGSYKDTAGGTIVKSPSSWIVHGDLSCASMIALYIDLPPRQGGANFTVGEEVYVRASSIGSMLVIESY